MSALARTPKLPRNSSAQSISLPKYEELGSGSLVYALPRYTLAVVPSIEIQSPSLTVMVLPPTVDGELLPRSLIAIDARADDAGASHAARDHRRVAGLAADRGQNALGDVHAVNVVRRGFLAHQNHRTVRGHLHGVFGA